MKLAAAVAVVVMALLIGIAVGMTLKSAPESSGPPDTASAAEIRRLDQEVDRLTSALVAAEAREQAAVEARAAGSPEPIAVESQPLSGAAGATAAEESADADEAEPGAQLNTIEPEEIRLRLRLSLFSSGTLLVVWARPFPFTKPSDVVGAFFRTAQRTVGLEGEEEEAAREVIGRWLEGVPRELVDETGNALDLEGMVKTVRVIAWAKLTQDLLETLADRLGFDADRLAKARNVQLIPVPVKNPAEER